MNFPVSSSLKGMLLKGSPLFCGTMGVSLGGWYTNENANSVHNQLLSEGYKYKVTEPNLSSEAVKNITRTQDIDVFEFKNGKCVETFFPGFEQISWTYDAHAIVTPETLSLAALSSENEKSIGCVLMESDEITDKTSHAVKSELTFKKGNKGFILWTGSLNEKCEVYHFLVYLEKDNNEKWNFKGGYGFNATDKGDIIKTPGSLENLSKVNKKMSYAGVWEESDIGGFEILKDVYGKTDKFTNSHIISWSYKISEKKWKLVTNNGMDVKAEEYLPQVLNISKNKKGDWTDVDNFCWNFSLRNLDLKDLCYEKK